MRDLAGPAFIVGLVVLWLFASVKWPCPLATIFHVPCPTCGMTRAARCVLRGDLAGANAMHPLWLVVLPACALAIVVELRGFAKSGAWGAAMQSTWLARVGTGIVVMLVVVWIARFFGAFGGPVAV